MVAVSNFSGLFSSPGPGESCRNGADGTYWSGAWPLSVLKTSKLTAPDFERFALMPCPIASLASSGMRPLSSPLGILMLEIGLSCSPKYARELSPSIRRAHVDDPHRLVGPAAALRRKGEGARHSLRNARISFLPSKEGADRANWPIC